jgi:hypothetical protein
MCPLEQVPEEKPAKKASQPTNSTLTNADAEFIMLVADWLYLDKKYGLAKELLHVVLRAGRVEQ